MSPVTRSWLKIKKAALLPPWHFEYVRISSCFLCTSPASCNVSHPWQESKKAAHLLLCQHVATVGQCPKARCPFAHSEAELLQRRAADTCALKPSCGALGPSRSKALVWDIRA